VRACVCVCVCVFVYFWLFKIAVCQFSINEYQSINQYKKHEKNWRTWEHCLLTTKSKRNSLNDMTVSCGSALVCHWQRQRRRTRRNNNKQKKSQYPYMLPPRGVSTAHRTRTNFVGAGNLPNAITHAKCQIDWYKIVPLTKGWCFSITTADAINTAKLCRAACDNKLILFARGDVIAFLSLGGASGNFWKDAQISY